MLAPIMLYWIERGPYRMVVSCTPSQIGDIARQINADRYAVLGTASNRVPPGVVLTSTGEVGGTISDCLFR